MENEQFVRLEARIDDLIGLCTTLNRENQLLKREASLWQEERQRLLQRQNLIRERMEQLIQRLKALEQAS
jgi:cell division protein ZapB